MNVFSLATNLRHEIPVDICNVRQQSVETK